MKILLVSYFFPPMNVIGAVRVGKFAKYLLEAGHDVRVLTAEDDNFPQGLPEEIPEDRIYYTDPIRVNNLPLKIIQYFPKSEASEGLPAPPKGIFTNLGKIYRTLLNFPDGQIGWIPSAMRQGSKIIEDWRPDIIYASAMPFTSLMVSAKLSKRYGIPYVAELRDLWINNHYYNYPAWRRVLEERLEKRTLRQASAFVTVSDSLADTLRHKYGVQTQVALNGFDLDDFPKTSSLNTDKGKVVRIAYTGIIYPGRRDPTPLFKALKGMGDKRHAFHVDFYGRRFEEISDLIREYGIEDIVQVHGQVSYHESLKIQKEADILLLLLWNTAKEKGIYTGKLFEYLGAGRPILSLGLEEGVVPDLIRSRDAGYVSNNSDQIITQLLKWSEQKSKGELTGTDTAKFSDMTRQSQFAVLEVFLRASVPVSDIRRIKIDVVVNHLGIGGTERHLSQILPQLDHRLFDVTVWTLRAGGALEETLKKSGVPVRVLSCNYPTYIRRIFMFFRLLVRFWKSPPDIVHCFLPESYLLAGLASVFAGHARLVMSRRSLNKYQERYPMLAKLENWLHHRASALLGNSQAVIKDLKSEVDEGSKVGLIYNGIDLEYFDHTFDQQSIRSELSIADDTVVFVIIANLIKYKGYFDLLEAMKLFNDKFRRPWKLLCIGRDDGIGSILMQYSRDAGIEENIVWTGSVPDTRPFLSAADIGINCSHEEGFSNSILECMVATLPLVVTNVGGNSEAVIDGVTGLIVPPESPESLSEALLELAINEPSRLRMGKAGRKHVVNEFSHDKCVKKYAEFYNYIITDPTESVEDRFPARA